MGTRVLLRAKKGPFDVVDPGRTLETNVIGNNSGNLVFSHAAAKILSTAQTEVVPNGFSADLREADRINDEFDAFVVPLANAFRPSFLDSLRNLTDLIEQLRIPVVVLGVGAQTGVGYDPARLAPLESEVRRFMRAVLRRSPTVGVRGEFTESYLRGLGFSDVEVIGCPSMFMYGDRLTVEKRHDALKPDARIALTVSPYVKAMAPIVNEHVSRYPHLTYVAQDLETLRLMLWGEQPDRVTVPGMPVEPSHPLYRDNRMRFFVDPWPWIDFLRGADFSFGTRIHGTITALIAGTPAMLLAHDSRTLELARYFDIPYRLIAEVPPDVDAAYLYEQADFTALGAGHARRLDVMAGYLERHGLAHTLRDPAAIAAFEARVAATAYPPAVQTVNSADAEQLRQRVTYLRERNRELETRLARRAARRAAAQPRPQPRRGTMHRVRLAVRRRWRRWFGRH